MKIIALSGWKRSGKDTVADHLVKNGNFVKFSFANVLKDMVAEQYNIPRNYCDDAEFKEAPLTQYPVETKDAFGAAIHKIMYNEFAVIGGPVTQDSPLDPPYQEPEYYWTPRALCILEGSVKRSVNSSYWVQRVIDNIRKDVRNIPEKYHNFVIADLRYKSEVEQLKDAFGTDCEIVRINRFDNSPSTDASERDLDDYDGFDNVLNVKDLDIDQVKGLIDMIYIGRNE